MSLVPLVFVKTNFQFRLTRAGYAYKKLMSEPINYPPNTIQIEKYSMAKIYAKLYTISNQPFFLTRHE
ncbi:MAG: hypothetical protein UY76_C0018G0012 [Candidatus Uhrbacteria bacterium GW2011_GWA2_52_8d]|uniref:Uncharacterized protein n=1 Tax=Candidatus Uhrbacteria bacterium GW2011_GWA2_52_8d TaxID=1618979 RepID=A0A0G2AJI6_9BACT|nr:MAG: hypothetical protein UY76_C0018G0012 [Candidatus Uhrbacteria bacterium GW2011_GWA2_52_8d]